MAYSSCKNDVDRFKNDVDRCKNDVDSTKKDLFVICFITASYNRFYQAKCKLYIPYCNYAINIKVNA